jgi:hypothetical protein
MLLGGLRCAGGLTARGGALPVFPGRLSNLTDLDLTDNQTRSPPVETAARGTKVRRPCARPLAPQPFCFGGNASRILRTPADLRRKVSLPAAVTLAGPADCRL